MLKISRAYSFSASHRIEGHPKCGRDHGHNYEVIVTLEGPVGDNGMVLDYGELDKIVKPIIDGELDHRRLVSNDNLVNECPYAKVAIRRGEAAVLNIAHSTAEDLAYYLHGRIGLQLKECGKFSLAITVIETPKSTAVYSD